MLTMNMCYDVIRVLKREGNGESRAKVVDGMNQNKNKKGY